VSGVDKPNGGFPFPKDSEREPTQRTRSVLFLTLAALVARRHGVEDVVVIAENGQMAIHLPLTTARIGAFSTHTAHPEFVGMMTKILSKVLEYPIRIENTFLYKTKAEVVEVSVRGHRSLVEGTVSCWKASRVVGDKKHTATACPASHGVSL
jgi:7-cyano-7-deazaguanine synthase in queuosine biosynthesis